MSDLFRMVQFFATPSRMDFMIQRYDIFTSPLIHRAYVTGLYLIFMAKIILNGQPPYLSLRLGDSASDVDAQWAMLGDLFLRRGTALISHHKNHYALIFAMREWETEREDDGGTGGTTTTKRVRQLLTARRGQRPNAWIDFKEMRNTYLSWEGYKLMAVWTERAGEREEGGGAAAYDVD